MSFLRGSDIDAQFQWLIFLSLKDKAEYEDGRDTQISRASRLTQIYAIEVVKHLKKVGGMKWFLEEGTLVDLMLGEVEDLWDTVAIARYPSRKAMLQMMMSSRVSREVQKHRSMQDSKDSTEY